MNGQANILIVPMHVDALLLKAEKLVTEGTANFADLPHNDGSKDYNYEVPHISEFFLSKPFQNQQLVLSKGVHIHWAIPASLAGGNVSDKPGDATLSFLPFPTGGLSSEKGGIPEKLKPGW